MRMSGIVYEIVATLMLAKLEYSLLSSIRKEYLRTIG